MCHDFNRWNKTVIKYLIKLKTLLMVSISIKTHKKELLNKILAFLFGILRSLHDWPKNHAHLCLFWFSLTSTTSPFSLANWIYFGISVQVLFKEPSLTHKKYQAKTSRANNALNVIELNSIDDLQLVTIIMWCDETTGSLFWMSL